MRENTDQKNSKYGHFSRSVFGSFNTLFFVIVLENKIIFVWAKRIRK